MTAKTFLSNLYLGYSNKHIFKIFFYLIIHI